MVVRVARQFALSGHLPDFSDYAIEICLGENVRFWPKAGMSYALHMSAFGGRADIPFAARTSAFDPKRTCREITIEAKFTRHRRQH